MSIPFFARKEAALFWSAANTPEPSLPAVAEEGGVEKTPPCRKAFLATSTHQMSA